MSAPVRALNALADVICRAQAQGRVTPMGIAHVVEAAGLVQSPETAAEHAAEVEALRVRVAELEAERHATNGALAEVTVACRAAEAAADRLRRLLAPSGTPGGGDRS